MTAKLLKQGYQYHKLHRAFSKFYRRHSKFIVKYNVGPLLALKFFCNNAFQSQYFMAIWFKFKRIVGKLSFHDQFKKVITHYKRGYSMDVMRQSASNHGLKLFSDSIL